MRWDWLQGGGLTGCCILLLLGEGMHFAQGDDVANRTVADRFRRRQLVAGGKSFPVGHKPAYRHSTRH